MLKFGNKETLEIVINSWAQVVGSVTVTGITRSGIIKLSHATKDAVTGKNTTTHRIDDIPIMLTAMTNDSQVHRSVLVTIDLKIGGDVTITLMSGYIGGWTRLAWPNVTQGVSFAGRGFRRYETTANPAAGAQVSYTFEDYLMLLIQAVSIRLVTDATAANRRAHFIFQGSGGTFQEFISPADQTASQTIDYRLVPVPAAGTLNDDDNIIVPIPKDLLMYKAGTFTTTLTNGQAGDDWGAGAIESLARYLPANA